MKFKKTKLILISALAMQASFSMAGMQGQSPFEGLKSMTMEERRAVIRERIANMRNERKSSGRLSMEEKLAIKEQRRAFKASDDQMPGEMSEPVEVTPVVEMPETDGESIREQLKALAKQFRAGEITREEFDLARNEVLGIDEDTFSDDDEEDMSGERTSYETTSTSTTDVEVTGGLVTQCSAGQFTVSIDVTPETNCTLSQTVKMGEEETVSEESFSGAKVNMIALPADSIASIAATLSCTNQDGTFGGSANASTQSGCTASFPEIAPEVSAERLQMQLDSALEKLQASVEADKAKLAEMEAAGEDTAFFKDFLVSGNEYRVESQVKSMTFIFQDRLPAEELDAALMTFKETAAALIATI